MRKKERKGGLLYAVVPLLAFLLFAALLAGGLFLFYTKGDFYSAFKGELRRSFLLSAGFLLLFSSILYTPVSYGISHYLLRAREGQARAADLFFLFKKPRLMIKAMVVSTLKKVLIYLERLALLLAAALLEVALFFLFLLVTGEDLFGVQGNPFLLAAEFMLRSPLLIALSVLLWSGVLFGILLIQLRYILCKYVLLCFPDASPRQAIRVGRSAIRGRLLATVYFYLRYAALFLLNLLSFGASPLGESAVKRSFSVYACRLAEEGWRQYCNKRSKR